MPAKSVLHMEKTKIPEIGTGKIGSWTGNLKIEFESGL